MADMTKEEFAQLVLDSTDSLYRVSKGILRNDADCEDAVWEAVSIGFEKLHTLRQPEYAKTWLIRILINECYAVLRRRRISENLRENYEWRAEQKEYPALYEALQELDEKYRIPVILFHLEGYTVSEIAEILQSTEGTVKSWLSRGRKKLRILLEEDDGCRNVAG